jgi:heterotetrameric sarcosine oxidase gamma subunit
MHSLAATSALVESAVPAQNGVTLRERPTQIVHLSDRREDPAHRQRIAQAFGVEPPDAPNTVAVGSASIAWIAPGQWLAIGEAVDARDGVDVSDAYCALHIGGSRAAELLSKSAPIDLAASAFPQGRCARTLLGSIPIFLMREREGFLVLVERSLAHAAWTWLADGAGALSR